MFSVASNSLNAGAINIDTNYTVTLNLDYIGYGMHGQECYYSKVIGLS